MDVYYRIIHFDKYTSMYTKPELVKLLYNTVQVLGAIGKIDNQVLNPIKSNMNKSKSNQIWLNLNPIE